LATISSANPFKSVRKEIFETGQSRDSYVKPRDAGRILRDNDLSVAISQCAELKALVNTILRLCGGEIIA